MISLKSQKKKDGTTICGSNMYKNLIFDIDGTIIDTLPSITSSVNATLKHFNKNYSYRVDEVYNFVGYGTPYLLKKAFKSEDIDVKEISKFYLPIQLEIHLKNAKIYPDLKEVLTSLRNKGHKLYVATNKPIEIAPKIVENLYGKGFFIDMMCPGLNTPKKPDPYLLNELIKRNNLVKKECLYIGDGEADLLTAKNAGIDCCLVKYGYGQYGKFDESYCKYVINSPLDLLKLFK